MDWKRRIPDGVDDLTETSDGFRAGVAIPGDEDGYIGRTCPSCSGHFRMDTAEFNALPDETRLTCPYCGHEDDGGEFMTQGQANRTMAAAQGISEQMVHQKLGEIFGQAFGGGAPSSSGAFRVEFRHTPSPPPAVRPLPEIVEEKVRRVIACPNCGTHYAVFGISAFCPVCGPRTAVDTALETVAAARRALCLEDHLPEDERQAARADGVFEKLAVDTAKNIVGVFEVFARAEFFSRAQAPEDAVHNRGNIFQRLDDTATLFRDHCSIDLPTAVGTDTWRRLREDFARRHVLVHNDGTVDQKFLAVVPNSGLQEGRRLVITRADAERALADIEAVIRHVSNLG